MIFIVFMYMAAEFFALDKTDRKIIAALEENSRQSNKAIAKKARANEHVVAYRIQRLINEGIIKKIYCVINRGALFPIGYRIFLRFQSLSAERENALIKRLVECKYTNWVVSCRGRWDMIVSMFVKDPNHFMSLFKETIAGFEDFIQEKEVVSCLTFSDFNRAYLYGGQPVEMVEYDGKFSQTKVDSLEQKILEQLSTNSRLTLIEMAGKFDVSPDTIRNRIKKLEKEKVILGHGVLLNLKKLGLGYYTILLNLKNLSKEREKAFRDFALQHPNILFWIRTIGVYDLNIELEIEEHKLDGLIVELRNKFGDVIKNLEVLSIVEEFKYTYLTQK